MIDRATQLYALFHNGKQPSPDWDPASRKFYQSIVNTFDATHPGIQAYRGTTQTSGHSLRVTFEPDNAAVRLALVCHETGRAACRLTCSHGCETWDVHSHDHELVEHGECNAVLWIGQNAEEYCEIKYLISFPLYDGMPVTVTWDSDTYVWAPITTSMPALVTKA
jgi:hypothetical protein